MHSETTRRHLPDAASVYCLMGKLWVGYGYVDQAIDCYVEAVKLNPFMWDAFLGLCHSGMGSSSFHRSAVVDAACSGQERT